LECSVVLLRCVPPVVALVAILGSGFTVGSADAASPTAAKAGDLTLQCKSIQVAKQREDCKRQARNKLGQDRTAPSKSATAKPTSVKAAGPVGTPAASPSVAAAPPAAAPGSPAPPMPAAVEISTR
jgi:hypothetical protein